MKTNALCVDLDGTLIRTDALYEGVVALCRRDPVAILKLPLWLIAGGRSGLKHSVAGSAGVNPAAWPYNIEFLNYLKKQHAAGRTLVLATAADEKVAAGVNRHLGIFDHIVASNGTMNCKGAAKLNALQQITGEASFTYAGNSNADFPIWEAAAQRIAVNAPASVELRLSKAYSLDGVFDRPKPKFRILRNGLRAERWWKNTLVFVPLLFAQEYQDPRKLWYASIAAICFSLCASGVYLVNDLLDLESDRAHPEKRSRPLASGDMAIQLALMLAPVLFACSFALAWYANPLVLVPLLCYLLLSTAYSYVAKTILAAKVLLLTCLYTLRVMAGGIAAQTPVSEWLLLFSIFIFLSLALAETYCTKPG